MLIVRILAVGVSLRWSQIFHFLFGFFQAYHSQIKDFSASVGNMAILPLRTQQRGPAPTTTAEQDIIDESLYFFKSNVFFRTYEIKVSFEIISRKSPKLTWFYSSI